MQSYRKSIRSHFLFYERLYHETLLCTLSNFVEGQVTDTGWKNGFAQICSLEICHQDINPEQQTYSKHGKCHICLVIYTPCFCCSIFTYLRHICKEQICVSPCFLPSVHVRDLDVFTAGHSITWQIQYSRTPVTRTLKGNEEQLELARVWVMWVDGKSQFAMLKIQFAMLKIDSYWFFSTSA